MCDPKASFRKRSFAKLMANADEESHRYYKERKEHLFNEIHGQVIELGPGTGVNFPFLPRDIHWVGVEPNAAMHPFLQTKAEQAGINVKLVEGLSNEDGVLEDSFDFAVSTLVLCSVPDIQNALGDIRRALKPGGRFLFIEHVVDPKNRTRRFVQKFVNYTPWRYFSDGCNPGRDIANRIAQAGFNIVECQSYMQDGKGIINWVNKPHISGWAQK